MSDGSAEHPDPQPPEQGESPVPALPGIAAFAAMGMTVAILMALGVVLGLWADRSFGTAPWGLVLGIVLSTVTAVVSVVQQVRRFL